MRCDERDPATLLGQSRWYAQAMAIVIDLSPEVEASYAEEARRRGIAVDQLLRELLTEGSPVAQNQEAAKRIRRMFEKIHAIVGPGRPVIPDEALRRENLYSREDDFR